MNAPAPRRPVDAMTRAAQERASDPDISAWVSANAGSGKTHVLTQRVLRLLLKGAQPSSILCLTFTKAAAANMSARVFKTLSAWTALDDDGLVRAILACGAPQPSSPDLALARRLFARTIETPGGLKIQTLHAFCEKLLHLFPFEANVAAGFRVLEDRESADLLRDARARAFAASENAQDLADAIELIARLAGPDGFEALLRETLKKREEIEAFGGAEAYGARLAARLGLRPGESETTIRREMIDGGGGAKVWRVWARQLSEGLKTDTERAALLTGAAATSEAETAVAMYQDAFFTQAGGPRKTLLTKGLSDRYPDLADELYDEQARLEKLRDRLRSATAVARSRALVRAAEEVLKHYSEAKNAHGWLDFDDLIQRTLALLQNADAAWVLYKLDRGVDHILVDEAQDTSRAQWDILRKLAEDFLSGESASARRRTFFAVGDEKQSIFSFQGAAPAMFDAMRREFKRRHDEAGRILAPVSLHLSFRSSRQILKAVDRVFAVGDVWRGVSAGEATAPPHDAFHQDLPGLVEVWTPIAPEPAPEPADWRMPLDAVTLRDPAAALADRIAKVVNQWLSPQSGERVIDKSSGLPRRIRAGDILILVRSRGSFFEAMTRALRRAEIASAGADRLILNQHIAVMDLVAAGRAALSADDDLSLAAVLKSPLIGLDDEALLRIAPGRAGSLADALASSEYREAEARLAAWRQRARKLSPFDFYARLTGVDGGRRALIGRLGPEAADAIDEFMALALAFDSAETPSLTAFLDEVEASEVAIKRDMEAEGSSVRVMTVHAAKGLEAPIVFLPDTAGAPGGRHDPKWLELDPAAPGMFVWAPARASDSAPIAAARTAAQDAAAGEHRRLLYVAMTRAAERLIVAGFEGLQGRAQDCWYDMIRMGLDPVLAPAPAPWDAQQTILRYGEGAQPVEAAPSGAPTDVAETPDWLWRAPPREAAPASLAPSRAAPSTRAPPSPQRRERMEMGRLAHALLQELPATPPELRPAAAEQFLARNAGTLSLAQRDALAGRVLATLAKPELAALFGPGSRAEVAIAGALPRPGETDLAFSGRIDRLAVGQDALLVADFKTGENAGGAARAGYVAQLALYRAALAPLYPDKTVRALLVWLDLGRIDEIPASALDEALLTLLQQGGAPGFPP